MCVVPPLFLAQCQSERWELSKPVYGIAASRKEWYRAPRDSTVKDLWGGVDSLGNSVSSGEKGVILIISENACDVNVSAVTRTGFLKLAKIPDQMKREMR